MSDCKNMAGKFITFEGGEGVGKSTQIQFLADALRNKGQEVVCLRDPGFTATGESIRQILLDPNNSAVADQTELLLYEAARAQLVVECIVPALQAGQTVLCDRYTDSTVAYQYFGRGISLDVVRRANEIGSCGVLPDLTIWLKKATAVGVDELGDNPDRIELAGVDFHKAVLEGFAKIATAQPGRFIPVQVKADKKETARLVWRAVENFCKIVQ